MRCRGCRKECVDGSFPIDRRTKTGRSYFCEDCHLQKKVRSTSNQGSRHYHLIGRYGIGAAEVEALIQIQGGVCAVCKRRPPTQVDHDHQTGVVRGVLCDGCNGGLGHFRDDPALIRRAIDYLKNQP